MGERRNCDLIGIGLIYSDSVSRVIRSDLAFWMLHARNVPRQWTIRNAGSLARSDAGNRLKDRNSVSVATVDPKTGHDRTANR